MVEMEELETVTAGCLNTECMYLNTVSGVLTL